MGGPCTGDGVGLPADRVGPRHGQAALVGADLRPAERLQHHRCALRGANYLDYLRQMGFRTFADFWDEDYDGYEAADRLLKIQSLINLLASKSINELEKMYWDMQYTLDHNYNLLMTQSYHKQIKEII